MPQAGNIYLAGDKLIIPGANINTTILGLNSYMQRKFGCKFAVEFIAFIGLMAEFQFPGDILNVARDGEQNDNDDIAFVYDHEREYEQWPENLIPFYAIGNGDYFYLDATDSLASRVLYFHHGNRHVEEYSGSFEIWLMDLPNFLSTK